MKFFFKNYHQYPSHLTIRLQYSDSPLALYFIDGIYWNNSHIVTLISVTPLDVVKIRLQAQQKALVSNKCFLYCNGLMDHLCTCPGSNGNNTQYWYQRPSHFTGTLVIILNIHYNHLISWSEWFDCQIN